MRRPNDNVYGWYRGFRIYTDINNPMYYVTVDGEEIEERNVGKLKSRIDWRLRKKELKK